MEILQIAFSVAPSLAAAIIGGTVVAFVTHRLQAANFVQSELWRARYAAYIDAIEMVNKKLVRPEYDNHNGPAIPADLQDKMPDVIARLELLSDDGQIPIQFLNCFAGYMTPEEKIEVIDRFKKLVSLCRRDLGSKNLPIPSAIKPVTPLRKVAAK